MILYLKQRLHEYQTPQKPIARFTLNTLRQTHPHRWRMKVLWMLPLLIVASIPLWVYLTKETVNLLNFMLLTVILTQLALHIQTLLLVTETHRALWADRGNLDLLQMTGLKSRDFVFGQFWTIWRYVLGNYVGLIVLRLGFLIGLAQYLHIGRIPDYLAPNVPIILGTYTRNYNYISHNGIGDYVYWNPILLQIGLALVMLVLFTLLEIGLMVTIGLWVTTLPVKRRELLIGLGLTVRMVIVTVVLTYIYHLEQLRQQLSLYPQIILIYCYDTLGQYPSEYALTYPLTFDCDRMLREQNVYRIYDTYQLGFISLIDSGNLITVNLLRPNLSRYYDMSTLDFHYKNAFTMDRGVRGSGYVNVRFRISAWRFIVRMFASAGFGMLLYVLLIYTLLRAAQFTAARRGFVT